MTPAHHDYLPDVLAERRRRFHCESTLVQTAVFAVIALIAALLMAICPEMLISAFVVIFIVSASQVAICRHRYRQLRKAPRA